VDLILLVYAAIGSRIARDAQKNVSDLRRSISQFSTANIDLKATAEALRENEQRLFSIYNTVRDVIFHLAVEAEGRFRFLSVNAAFLRITGLGREEVVGKTVDEVIPEPSRTIVLQKYRQAVEENAIVSWEETSDYPTGRLTGVVTIAPVLDQHGVCTHLVGSVHDITERKRAEAMLRESEERFRTVADTAPVMIWMAGLDKVCTFVNKPWLEFTGRTMEQELGDGWLSGVHPEDRDGCFVKYSSMFDARRAFQMEYRLRRADGEYRWILDSGSPRYRESEFAGYIGSCIDVTEAKRSQEESFARQKLESLGTLSSGIAHDFNNLLGAVMAQADLALAEYASGASPNEPLKTIQNVALRGSEIVEQLMVYAGNEREVLELVNVSWVVEEMLSLLKVSVSKHAVLEAELAEGLAAVRGKAAQVRQVVMNLVTNASEAIGDRDGILHLTTRAVTVSRATGLFKDVPEGDYVELAVSDTGAGMPPETQARVFDPFFTTKSAGRGLGLPVVHGIVRSLGGGIQIASEPGTGTTVRILLPSVEATADAIIDPVPSGDEPARQPHRFTVLVVEDEDPLRQALVKTLRREGFEVYEASNGSAAIDRLRADGGKVDLILLDMTIPGASSPEVVSEAARVRPDIKVIVTSAYSREMIMDKMGASQIYGFIRKPFRLLDLTQMLQDVVVS
jgi:PAS domain S-box-containing protein